MDYLYFKCSVIKMRTISGKCTTDNNLGVSIFDVTLSNLYIKVVLTQTVLPNSAKDFFFDLTL